MTKNLFDTSEHIRKLRNVFRDYGSTGLQLSGPAVDNIMSQLEVLLFDVRQLECEVSRLRWNSDARSEQALLAACAENSNVVLFPTRHRDNVQEVGR